MSSRVRLLLVSGTPGSGVSTVAEAHDRALRAAGHRTLLVRDDDWERCRLPASLWADLAAGVGMWLRSAGADPLHFDELGSVPGLDDVTRALQVASVLSDAVDEDIDVVVWDAGSLRSALRVLGSTGLALLLLERLVTAATTSSRPTDWEAIDRLRSDLSRAQQLLVDAAVARIVVQPTEQVRQQAAWAVASLMHAGCPVDAVFVNQVPAMDVGWPEPWAAERRSQADQVADLGETTVIIPMLAVPQADRPSAIRSLLPDGIPPRPASMVTVDADHEPLLLRIAMRCAHSSQVRVGQSGERVVIAFDGRHRLLDLPSVLRRCRMQGASLQQDGLVIRFVPDPAAWPESMAP